MDFLRFAVDPDAAETARQAAAASAQLAITIAFISAGAALVGALIGAMTSFLLQQRQFKATKEHERTLRRDAALSKFLTAQNAFINPSANPDFSAVIARLNTTMHEYSLTLNRKEQAVYEFATGMMRNSARTNDLDIRVTIASQGSEMLVDWTRGVIPMSKLKPFEIASTDEHGRNTVNYLPHWPDRP